jgi:energy-coupling factor transporter ATP-binding protein EcfA2
MELFQYITPKTVDKFVANKLQIKSINEFLNISSAKNILCIIGPDGCGKTTLCQLLFNKHNKQVLEIGKDNLPSSDIKQILQNFANNMTIDTMLFKKEKVVFVDDIDILMNVDRLILSKLISVDKILKNKKIKVILTCSVNEERKINEYNKYIDIVALSYPLYKDSYAYLMNCFNINDIDHDPKHLLDVSHKCKGNIREIILNLETSNNDLNEKSIQEAFKDLNNFEITKKILHKKCSKEDLEYFQQTDIGIIPYMLYENIPNELDTNYKFKRGKSSVSLIDCYKNINNNFIEASMFEEKAYSSLDWQYYEYANMIKMNSIYSTLQSLEQKASVKDVKYRFSQMLSKTSHRNILAKKVKEISNDNNVSNMMVVNAVDVHTQNNHISNDNEQKPKKKSKQLNSQSSEITSLITTFEKYFTLDE